MELAHRWISRDLTRIELTVSILLIALFIGSFGGYTFIVFGKVEKSMIERTVLNINTAMHYHASFALMNNDIVLLSKLEKMNPMELMTNNLTLENLTYNKQTNNTIGLPYITVAPSNYGGEVLEDSEPSLESGKWYYDIEDHVLFYTINNSEFFSSDLDGPARVRYKISLDYTDMNDDNEYTPFVDKFDSIKLQTIDLSGWIF